MNCCLFSSEVGLELGLLSCQSGLLILERLLESLLLLQLGLISEDTNLVTNKLTGCLRIVSRVLVVGETFCLGWSSGVVST